MLKKQNFGLKSKNVGITTSINDSIRFSDGSGITSRTSKQSNKIRGNNSADLIVVSESHKGVDFPDVVQPRSYWRVINQLGTSLRIPTRYVLRLEASEEKLEQSKDVTTSGLSSFPPLSDIEDEPRDYCDVFPTTHKPKVLFSQKVEIQTAELPRWKPHITIDRWMLEDEDE